MDVYKNIFSALSFSATKHRHQRRKGFNSIPYINHPIGVADVVVRIAKVDDVPTIQAALLHDIIEDTKVTPEELNNLFGGEVASIVLELTDDTSLSSTRRKEIQVEKAKHLSHKAKLIRIADKICNIDDLVKYPMPWSRKRKINYVHWSRKVVEECKGINKKLEFLFEETAEKALNRFEKKVI